MRIIESAKFRNSRILKGRGGRCGNQTPGDPGNLRFLAGAGEGEYIIRKLVKSGKSTIFKRGGVHNPINPGNPANLGFQGGGAGLGP